MFQVLVGKVINEESPLYNAEFAVKVMDKRHIVRYDKTKYVKIEKEVFIKCATHPNICHLHFSFQDPYSLCLVMVFFQLEVFRKHKKRDGFYRPHKPNNGSIIWLIFGPEKM